MVSSIDKVCSSCNVKYPNTEEYFKRKKYKGNWVLQSQCKECARIKALNYYYANHDVVKTKAEKMRRDRGSLTKKEAGLRRRVERTPEYLEQQREKNRLSCLNAQAKRSGFKCHEQKLWAKEFDKKLVKILKKVSNIERAVIRKANKVIKTEEELKLQRAIHRKAFKQRNWEKYRLTKLTERDKRTKQQLLATPTWVDQREINKVRRECIRLNKTSITEYEIDHIDPLLSPLVCGLHVHNNLQILPKEENRLKSNKFKPYAIDALGNYRCL